MPDDINNPTHYMTESGMEAIDVIEAFKLNYGLGNAVKYILRAGKKKGGTYSRDLRKAIWYLEREAKKLEKYPEVDSGFIPHKLQEIPAKKVEEYHDRYSFGVPLEIEKPRSLLSQTMGSEE